MITNTGAKEGRLFEERIRWGLCFVESYVSPRDRLRIEAGEEHCSGPSWSLLTQFEGVVGQSAAAGRQLLPMTFSSALSGRRRVKGAMGMGGEDRRLTQSQDTSPQVRHLHAGRASAGRISSETDRTAGAFAAGSRFPIFPCCGRANVV